MNTTSLDLSKRIATLEGGKGESEYVWSLEQNGDDYNTYLRKSDVKAKWYVNDYFPALTTDELLERLPASTSLLKRTDMDTKTIARYYAETFEHHFQDIHADTPAEALGLLYEHLLIKGLIT